MTRRLFGGAKRMLGWGKNVEWRRVYLIFCFISFMLGFLGYLLTEPPEVAERVMARWSDFTERVPLLQDLNWFNQTAPAFNRLDLPTVLLMVPENSSDPGFETLYPEFEARLKQYFPNIVRISDGAAADETASNETAVIANVTAMYRKYLLIGLGAVPADRKSGEPLSDPGAGNFQFRVGVPGYLAPELDAKIAAALPDSLTQFNWEQKAIGNGSLITVRWQDGPEKMKIKDITKMILRVLEAERAVLGKDYQI